MTTYPINIQISRISDDYFAVIQPSTGAPITLKGPFWAVSADLKQTLHKLESRSYKASKGKRRGRRA